MFLGIDCSTQSFKVQIINKSRAIEAEVVVVYDRDLPHYKTVNGIIRHIDHGFEHISTPTLLFIDAFELALSKLKENFDLSKVKAISGSGQQVNIYSE
jgi:xylulokinase